MSGRGFAFSLRSGAAVRRATAGGGHDATLLLPEAGIFLLVDASGEQAARALLETFSAHADRISLVRGKATGELPSADRLALAKRLEEAFAAANDAILHAGEAMHGGNSAICLALEGGMAYVAHVGGSRAYLVRRDTIQPVTVDHTLGMKRVVKGELSRADYERSPLRRMLTRSLGAGAEVAVDVAELRLQPGDVLVLASDGVTASVPDEELGATILDAQSDAEAAALELAATRASDAPVDDASAIVVKLGTAIGSRAMAQPEGFYRTLRGLFLFESLSDAELRLVSPYLEQRSVATDEVVCREGEPGSSFFVVVSGRLGVTRGDTFLVEVGPGEHVGELCLVNDQPRTATVTASEPAQLLELSRTSFRDIVEKRPDIGARLCLGLLKVLASRLSDTTDRLGLMEAAHFAGGGA